ncbi:hypothetical protein TUMEXPCC7403_11950 [Tumidithrix helvetica PCC 7403]|uniref:hypothetical protein n=1 Tax=Tumidithrix helvetica TaxID=3457545 RepID=UPI003C804089
MDALHNFHLDSRHSRSRLVCLQPQRFDTIATLQTMIFVFLRRSSFQMFAMTSMAIAYALTMIFHVFTWFIVGVVMAPTFILLGLGGVCLAINFMAIYIQLRHRSNAIVHQQLSIAK